MHRLKRIFLAVSVVAGLVPVVTVAAPEAFDEIWPWASDSWGYSSSHLARAELDVSQSDANHRTVHPASTLPCEPPACDRLGSQIKTHLAHEVTSTLPPENETVDDDATTTTAVKESGTATESSTTSTTADDATTTTKSTTPPKEQPKTIADGTISGTVCPCTVTGTIELKGHISLDGDLMVDGGTLVARPGVDVDGNGFQIMFMNGGRANFQGSKVFAWSDRGARQNLTRDINFRNMRRIVWKGGGPSVLKYITISNSGTSELGDYPLHWHLNGDSTRGTVVEGVVVVNGANHAFVPHGSHGITFKDIIAKNTRGHAFWWDPPGTNDACSFQSQCTIDNSNDIKVERALIDGVTAAAGSRGFRLTGFLLGAGSGNSIHNSVAINVAPGHIKDCSGFQWPEHANGNTGGNVWSFVNNHSSNPSGCHGIFVWQNDGNAHVIDGFTGGGIDHGAYRNKYEYRNIDVPYVEVHAAGWRVTSGSIDVVYTRSHRSESTPTAVFSNTSIDRFVIQNGNGEFPGHYLLNNTGLTCDDIEYELVFPGTTVTIDGTKCDS